VTSSSALEGRLRPWVWPTTIALLAITASIGGLLNQFAQDDIAIVWKNPRLHNLRAIGRVFSEPYWPPPFIPALYRPFSSVALALQWAGGGGSPLALRIVSYALYAVTCIAVFRLARLRLPLLPAFVAAALFAVHPVHVESVALGVNQSEIWVGLFSCLALIVYVRGRHRDGPVSPRTIATLAALFLIACLFKENALVLPGFIVAAEFLLVQTNESVRARVSRVRLPVLVLLLVALGFYWVRTLVLSGSLLGTPLAEGLIGLDLTGRALTMLGVAPHWFRLILWPAALQADYGPGELVAATSWGLPQTLGAMLLFGAIAAAVAAWRRAPVVTFGIAWCAIGLFPVHNVLAPTGVILAERTLFLPSIGAMLAVAGAGTVLAERRSVQPALAVLVGLLLVLGTFRSTSRHTIWRNQFILWYETANVDAPRSFRAHETLAENYFTVGVARMAEQEYRLAIQFAPSHITRPAISYANKLRLKGHCHPAADLYRTALRARPEFSSSRAGLIACLMHIGAYQEAKFHARMGASYEWSRPFFQRALGVADSALRVAAPPGTVEIKVLPGDTVSAFAQIGAPR
jgi:hypothetical protein